MPSLYNWSLYDYRGFAKAHGRVFGHPSYKVADGISVDTSPVQDAAVVDGTLVLLTLSGTEYHLRPEEIDPDRTEVTAENLAFFGVETGFVEDCLRARRAEDARLMEEEGRLLEPGELLLTTCWNRTIRALFRAADGALVSVQPAVHGGMFQDSILITDREGGRVDFRYFPTGSGNRIEPYHISDGLRVIKLHNLGGPTVFFGNAECEVRCPPGEITAIQAAEHDREGLVSPDAVNGKGLCKITLSSEGGKANERERTEDGPHPTDRSSG